MSKRFHILIALLLPIAAFGQALHNGIALPEEWPPRYPQPTVAQDMPLPYIESKPAVIPINTGRQLFVDDFLIAETTLQTVCHTPVFYPHNPVLDADKEWEKTTEGVTYAAPFSDGIWYDEKIGKFRMWYLAGAGSIHTYGNQTFYTCYAESTDGIHWTKPTLDIVPGTNIVDTSDRDASTVWLDRTEKDPGKRWKFFNIEKRKGDWCWRAILKYSADGIHWSKGVAQSGDLGDRTTAFYNPFTRKWVLSMRGGTSVSGRSRYYAENSDPEELVSTSHRTRSDYNDKHVVYWFTPSDKEKRNPKYPETDPGIYNFDAIAYESIILGLYASWSGPENDICKRDGIQKHNVICLGYSRDGFHFYRPTFEPFMDVNEKDDDAWNWGNMQSINGTPLIVNDSLYFYASGRHLDKVYWDGHTSTGLAKLRRDGFVSRHAGKEEGTLTTEPLTFDGKYLFVNVAVASKKSSLRIELLDKDGNIIPGFAKKDCDTLKGIDSTKQPVSWKGQTDLSALSNQTIRIKFYLTNGDLYAFWVSPWESGESRGYTAGGGPGLHQSGIDKK